jgi:hypothetical protein
MQLMADALFVERAEAAVAVEERGGLADCQNDVELAQLFHPPWAGQAGQEMRRGVEIAVVAVIAVEQVVEAFHLRRQIIAAGKSDELAEQVRMPENEGGGLEGAEAAAHRHRAIVGIGPDHQWKHLLEDIVLEGDVPVDAVGRMPADVVEGLPRQPLDAIELQAPGIDLVGQAGDDLELLLFPEAPVPRREHQHLGSGIAEDQELISR